MISKQIYAAVLIFFTVGCTDPNPKSATQLMDFGLFSMVVPNGWTKIKEKGFDSYVGRIAIDNTDTLNFDLGWYSNTLAEPELQIIERSMLKDGAGQDTSQFVIVDNARGIDPDKYKKNNVKWDTIDGRKAKIVFPRESGFGTTGIYIDSLWTRGAGKDRFNLYSENLKPVNETLFLQALKTLKFHKR